MEVASRLDKEQAYQLCKDHLHRYVMAQFANGSRIDGIVEGIDDDYLYLAMPGDRLTEGKRAFGAPFYPGYGYGYGYGYPYRRRFTRGIFPLVGLLGLALLPYY